MTNPANILVVDDEPGMLRYLQTLLEADSYRVATAAGGEEALRQVQLEPAPDLVLLDLLMPGLNGLQTLEQLRKLRPGLRVVMLSCVSDTRKVAQAVRLGAQDYLTKPFQKAALDAVLSHCLQPRSLAPEVQGRGDEIEELSDDVFFVAASPAMRRLRTQVNQVAGVNVPVLLLGESGTGKEVAARLIHKLSPRAQRPLHKVNCAALPGELLESELFGYEAGAFTGAARPKPGQFELCDKGTILLDEIGEMPPGLQAKLLHVLQDQSFCRLGGRTMVQVDVRILAATNIDIAQAIAAGKLRPDLYYRLNAFTLLMPPLRDRREEIPLLLRHFMALYANRYGRSALAVSPALVDTCLRHTWPGNLRELENFVKRYLILGDESLVLRELKSNLPAASSVETSARIQVAAGGDLKALVRGLKGEAEAEAISQALDRTKWNRKEAARLLQISYKALLYKIRQYNIDRV
ncbi:MAG TPA: sigma-54 dependent transcriptional regulator [Terriglobia bacterium]